MPNSSDRYLRHQASSSSLNEWNRSENRLGTSKQASRTSTDIVVDEPNSKQRSETQVSETLSLDENKSSMSTRPDHMGRSSSVDAGSSPSPAMGPMTGPKKWGLRAFLRVEKVAANLKAVSASDGRATNDSSSGIEKLHLANKSNTSISTSTGRLVTLDHVIQAQLSRASEANSDSGRSNVHSDALSFKHGMGSGGQTQSQARLKKMRESSRQLSGLSGLSFLEKQLVEARESIIEEEEEDSDRSKPGSFDLKGKGRLSTDSDWDVAGALSKLAPASGMEASNDSDKIKFKAKVSAPYVPSPQASSSIPLQSAQSQMASSSIQLDLGTRMQSIASHLNAMTDEELLDPEKSSELPRKLMDLAKAPLTPSADTGSASNDSNVRAGNGSVGSRDRGRVNGIESSGANAIGSVAIPGRGSNLSDLRGSRDPTGGWQMKEASGSYASGSMRGRPVGPLDSLTQLLMMSESQQSRAGEMESQAMSQVARAAGHRPPQRRYTTTDLLHQRILSSRKIEGSHVGSESVDSGRNAGAPPHAYPSSNDIVIGEGVGASQGTQKSGISSRTSSLSQTSLAQRAAAAAASRQTPSTPPLGTVQEGSAKRKEPVPQLYTPSGVYLPQGQSRVVGSPFRAGQLLMVDAEGRMVPIPYQFSNNSDPRGSQAMGSLSPSNRLSYYDQATNAIYQQAGPNATLETCLFVFAGIFLVANLLFIFYVVIMHSLQSDIKRLAAEFAEKSIRG